MNATSRSYFALAIGVCAAMLARPPGAGGEPTAHFELLLAAGEPDAILELGSPGDDQLEFEVWVEIDDAPPGALVQGFTIFLEISADQVISFDGSFTDCPFPFVFPQGTDNTPLIGDFSRAGLATTGIMAGLNSQTLYGRFSVSAVGPGLVSYTFSDAGGAVRPWSVKLKGLPELTGDALSFSIEPAASVIEVLLPVSTPDADGDGDVDLIDYAAFMRCVQADAGAPLPVDCLARDLNGDGQVNRDDLPLFVSALTGPAPSKGDLDADGDVDLGDFARMQLCFWRDDDPELANICRFADIDRDDTTDLADFALFYQNLTGPQSARNRSRGDRVK